MKDLLSGSRRPRPGWAVMAMTAIAAASLLAACAVPAATPAPLAPPATPAPTATPVPLKLLKTSPEVGPVGTTFIITGEELPPGREISFQWATWDGTYVTEAGPENVRFFERKFAEKGVALGSAMADAQGRVSATFTAPEDYGEVHDIFAVVDGQNIAKAGFRILRTATMTPTEGPVGTPITISIKGIGWKPFENTMALRYDNKYMGFLSAVTTRGTATFQIRAAGPVGKHLIQITGASAAAPYLNMQESPVDFIPDFRWAFTVTEGSSLPPSQLEWPDGNRVAMASGAVPRTTAGSTAAMPGLSAAMEPASGPILSQAALRASGLTPNTEVELLWVSARGNRLRPSGWSLTTAPLLKATAAQDGSLTANVRIPDDLGGWHVVRLVQGERTLAEVPYYVERSLVQVNPQRVKAGELFTVQIKGIGWTELDNGVAVVYDNAYIGYACGFNSNGNITLSFLVATGGPGIHLIDLYPMLYRARGNHPAEYWNFQVPQLTALQDHPGLALGYNLPIYRLAIEVVE